MAVNIYLDGATDQIFDVKAAGVAQKQIGNLSNLTTTDKTDLVSAINELKTKKADGQGIAFTIVNGVLTVTY